MDLLIQKIAEQLILVGISVTFAILVGVPLGIVARHSRKIQSIALGTANIFQTIPSLALLAGLLPVFGIGMTPAIIALTLYALLPILRNTVVGLSQIPAEYSEVAKGLGASNFQCLWKIELPLALPVIIAGIRIAVAMTIGIATIAAFIGAGGLGDFINRGLAMNNNHLLLMGAIPAALLALILDGLFAHFQKKPKQSLWVVLIIFLSLLGWMFYPKSEANEIRIGSKNFTEQYILGEIMAQMLEAKTSLKIKREFNLGTTEICQNALLHKSIDMYPEYTGTAYMTVLHQNQLPDAKSIFNVVSQTYKHDYHLIWLSPFGFNNSQSLTIREKFAKTHHLTTISDLIPYANNLVVGAPPEFLDRSDGYPALQKTYHISFKEIKAMDPNLMYQAIAHRKVDVIDAFTTDGRILTYHLFVLKDNKQAFPAYEAAPVIREDIIKAHPEILKVLNQLAGKISDTDMQQMNKKVDLEKKSPADVAHTFLIEKHLL